ncbi:MAG: IS66 family insertion sequence element accessory protein TnpB [Burkholderiaceae bacterium]|nr:IS66 family insertion sequence element accessory protein TnpB [Burkholderiaceae bacterium]
MPVLLEERGLVTEATNSSSAIEIRIGDAVIAIGAKASLYQIEVTDMRKGMDGLATIVQTVLAERPFSGDMFVFRGPRTLQTRGERPRKKANRERLALGRWWSRRQPHNYRKMALVRVIENFDFIGCPHTCPE